MKLIEYIKETQAELTHVSWPSRRQAITMSIIVILISVVTALLLSLFDGLFARGLKSLLPF